MNKIFRNILSLIVLLMITETTNAVYNGPWNPSISRNHIVWEEVPSGTI